MSSEALNGDEIDCSKKGDCVELKEVVVRAKSNTNAFFGYNFGSSNLQNNSSTLHRAIYRTPATKDIDNGINEVVKMANPAFGAVLIADDLIKGKEVDKLEYLAIIPAFKLAKFQKFGTIVQKTSPLLLETTRIRYLREVTNPRLNKAINYLYRERAKFGNGSTGSMIREEILNGTVTSGSGSHLQKASDGLDTMRKLLNGNYGPVPDSDRKIIFEIIKDLTDGTGLKW